MYTYELYLINVILNKHKRYTLFLLIENSTIAHSIVLILMETKELDAKGMFFSGSTLGFLSLKSSCVCWPSSVFHKVLCNVFSLLESGLTDYLLKFFSCFICNW